MRGSDRPEEPSIVERVRTRQYIENTQTYWAVLLVTKKDEPTKHEYIVESHIYTLPNIEYKTRRYYLEKVAKEFNQKLKEKYDPDVYQVSPIFWDTLYLKREDAEKVQKLMIEKEKIAKRESNKKR